MAFVRLSHQMFSRSVGLADKSGLVIRSIPVCTVRYIHVQYILYILYIQNVQGILYVQYALYIQLTSTE